MAVQQGQAWANGPIPGDSDGSRFNEGTSAPGHIQAGIVELHIMVRTQGLAERRSGMFVPVNARQLDQRQPGGWLFFHIIQRARVKCLVTHIVRVWQEVGNHVARHSIAIRASYQRWEVTDR